MRSDGREATVKWPALKVMVTIVWSQAVGIKWSQAQKELLKPGTPLLLWEELSTRNAESCFPLCDMKSHSRV